LLRSGEFGLRLDESRPVGRELSCRDATPRVRAAFPGGTWNALIAFALTRWRTRWPAYFVVDGVLSHVTQPIAVWLAKKKLFERVRLWIISLGPYPSLALFAVPLIILEPAKPLSAYLIGTGHFFAGAVIFITAEVLKLTFVERLFQLNRNKLLSIPAFAWGYQYWRHMMDVIESMEVWKASRRLVADAARMVRTRWSQFKRARKLSRLPYHS